MVADVGQFLETDHLNGHPGKRGFHVLAEVVDERADFSGKRPADERGADFQCAGFNDDRGGGAAAGNDARLDDPCAGGGFWVGAEFKDFRLEDDEFQQIVHALALESGDRGKLGVAAVIGGLEACLRELAFHPLDVRGWEVALVDGDDDRFPRLLGVLDGLRRLRHDAVVRGHHNDRDVGDVRAALAHVGENGVTGGVEEGDELAVVVHLVGTDVLGDPTGLAAHDLALAVIVEDRGFAVIDVTHDRDDGRTNLEKILRLRLRSFRLDDDLLDLVETLVLVALLALEGETVHFAHLGGDIRFKRLVGSGENAELDEIGHHVERLQAESRGEIRDEDGRLDDDELRIVGFVPTILCRSGWWIPRGRHHGDVRALNETGILVFLAEDP